MITDTPDPNIIFEVYKLMHAYIPLFTLARILSSHIILYKMHEAHDVLIQTSILYYYYHSDL
jgi:hypothetical protein